MRTNIQSVAIIGAGPAGATLAALLASEGKEVVLFDADNRPELVIGESLIPAVVSILRRLGVEDEVKSYSQFKPGASFLMDDIENHYIFDEFGEKFPGYAYNVPRDRFDATLIEAAKSSGAHIIKTAAKVTWNAETKKLSLSDEHQAMANEFLSTDGPDILVDATGRRRLFTKCMDLPSVKGNRSDTVLFAHFESADTTLHGNIHISKLTHGWNWFIPLPGKVSVGIVMDNDRFKQWGDSTEACIDELVSTEPTIKKYMPQPNRLTSVMKYSNYQWVSTQLVGDGWALVGDAAGFIDPVFSSGLFLGMDGAQKLADTIVQGHDQGFKQYEKDYLNHIHSWHGIVDHFYSGRLFALYNAGRNRASNTFSRMFRAHVYKHMGQILTGQAVMQPYSMWLLKFMTTYAIRSKDSSELKIQ